MQLKSLTHWQASYRCYPQITYYLQLNIKNKGKEMEQFPYVFTMPGTYDSYPNCSSRGYIISQ